MEMYKFRNFEEEYDSRVIIQTFEKIMNALEKGDYGMANSLVKFLDSSIVYLTGEKEKGKEVNDKILKRIFDYRERDDDVKKLKIDAEVKKKVLENVGFKNVDISFVLWHNLYSKWLRDLVLVLEKTKKLGKKTTDLYLEDE